MNYLDFTNAKEVLNEYLGSEKKKTMILDDIQYLVKFPDPNRSSKLQISYINNVFSEYIGSKVFESLGFNVQEVFLGRYFLNGNERIVCACKDFTVKDKKLIEFEKLENASVDPNPFKRELKDIFHIIEANQYDINKDIFKNFFWDMFIVDCLIGNRDRHNGNFGFLKDNITKRYEIAPIYDCGSCLNSTLTDEEMEEYLPNKSKMLDFIKNTPSAIKIDGSKLNYNNFINSLSNDDCNKALLRVYPDINMEEINLIINDIDCISEVRKEFYKEIIKGNYEQVLTPAYKKALKLYPTEVSTVDSEEDEEPDR